MPGREKSGYGPQSQIIGRQSQERVLIPGYTASSLAPTNLH